MQVNKPNDWRIDWGSLKEGDWVAFPIKKLKRPNLGLIKRYKSEDFENEIWVTQGKNHFPTSFFEGFVLIPSCAEAEAKIKELEIENA